MPAFVFIGYATYTPTWNTHVQWVHWRPGVYTCNSRHPAMCAFWNSGPDLGRLPSLYARPAVTFPAAEHHRPLAGTKLYCGELWMLAWVAGKTVRSLVNTSMPQRLIDESQSHSLQSIIGLQMSCLFYNTRFYSTMQRLTRPWRIRLPLPGIPSIRCFQRTSADELVPLSSHRTALKYNHHPWLQIRKATNLLLLTRNNWTHNFYISYHNRNI